jgi:hypothetical protein
MTTPYDHQAAAIFRYRQGVYTGLTDTLTVGTTYELTANVGNAKPDGTPLSNNEYTIELLAGTTVVASTTGVTSTNTMTETASFSFTPGPGHANEGETLSLRLTQSGGAYQAHAYFDNLSLIGITAASTVIPEPSTILIWSLGLIGLAAFVRRRTK